MPYSFAEKVVWVTGASSGIGRALALQLYSQGWHLGLCARRREVLEQVRAELRSAHPDGGNVEVATVDVAAPETIRPLLEHFEQVLGGVDTVVVNAGINSIHPVGKGHLVEDMAMVAINLVGAMATIDGAVRMFRSAGRGHVVGISSLAALRPMAGQAAYCATKAGLNAYLDSVRLEVEDAGIAVTTIMPGCVETSIVEGVAKYPFCVSAQRAATEIARHMERRSDVGIVPAYPWRALAPALPHLPKRVLKRLGKVKS